MESLISEDGHHIGITNAIERLNLLYSNDYTITFENNDTSGARIDVLVPYKELKGDSNEYTYSLMMTVLSSKRYVKNPLGSIKNQ